MTSRRPIERDTYAVLGGPRDGAETTISVPRGVYRWTIATNPPRWDEASGRRLYERYELHGWIGGEAVMFYRGVGLPGEWD